VENLLDNIRDPSERQLGVECLAVIARLEERNPEISLKGATIDLLSIIREAVSLFWKEWVSEQSHINSSSTDSDGKQKPIGLSVLHSHSIRLMDVSSPTYTLATKLESDKAKPATQSAVTDLSFEKNERLARRLFFDVRQDGESGTMAYLASSCIKLVFGVKWHGDEN
jgi:hypothetical protein